MSAAAMLPPPTNPIDPPLPSRLTNRRVDCHEGGKLAELGGPYRRGPSAAHLLRVGQDYQVAGKIARWLSAAGRIQGFRDRLASEVGMKSVFPGFIRRNHADDFVPPARPAPRCRNPRPPCRRIARARCVRPARRLRDNVAHDAAPPPAAETPPPLASHGRRRRRRLPVPATFDVAALADQIKPLVVNITTTHPVNPRADVFDSFFGQRGGGREMRQRQTALGTGFIIDRQRLRRDQRPRRRRRRQTCASGSPTIASSTPTSSAAIPSSTSRCSSSKGATRPARVALGSSDALRVGEYVLAVGNPFGLGHTVTMGIVSAKARAIGAGPYDDFIQTDASINPGNSGGPLFNWRGQVVGINTAIRAGANGIGFAIPIDAVKDILPQLRAKGHVERGKLGLVFQALTPDLAKAVGLDAPHGALVADVEPNGAAARAGIKAGDVILAVNAAPIVHAEELPRNVARNAPGKAITLTIERNGQKKDVQATLDPLVDDDAQAPIVPVAQTDQQTASKLGLQVSNVPGGGVRVDGIADGSVVRDIEPGDVILDVGGVPVTNVESLRAAMSKLTPGSEALVKVRRGRTIQFAAVPIPKK